MFEMNGKYNSAKIYANQVDAEASAQIVAILSREYLAESKIRFMPDVHAGSDCAVGTTLTMQESGKVSPYLLGSDIGCGVLCVKVRENDVNLELLDKAVRKATAPRCDDKHPAIGYLYSLQCIHSVSVSGYRYKMGDLGGGNHFVEMDRDEEGCLYLIIHSGSGTVGKTVAEYHQGIAIERTVRGFNLLEGSDLKHYIRDTELVCQYASMHRRQMACDILSAAGLVVDKMFDCPHNYIDVAHGILRKGAIAAALGKQVVIPINMKEGSLLCTGKGNSDWNYSAPHGAGRIMSRGQAKESISLEDYKESMKGVYTTSVSASTLDESPFAYRPMQEIIDAVSEAVQVDKILRPIYNFKRGTGEQS